VKRIVPAIVVALLFFAYQVGTAVVDETEKAVILQFGRPVRVINEPGLYFRIPFIQNIRFFDRRLLDYETSPAEVITLDMKTLVVDNFVRWRIDDPLTFLQRVQTQNGAQVRIEDIVYSEMRAAIGRRELIDIIANEREKVMADVTAKSREKAFEYGIEIVDVRIKRADLPDENEQAIYQRMQQERHREALRYRSEGREQAQIIRADADRQAEVILANAFRTAQELRGEGEARAARIYNEAYGADPEFFAFIRSLQSYRQTLSSDDTRLVLSMDDPYLDFLRDPR